MPHHLTPNAADAPDRAQHPSSSPLPSRPSEREPAPMTPPSAQAPRLGMPWTLLVLALLALAGLLGYDRYSAYHAVLTEEAQRLTTASAPWLDPAPA